MIERIILPPSIILRMSQPERTSGTKFGMLGCKSLLAWFWLPRHAFELLTWMSVLKEQNLPSTQPIPVLRHLPSGPLSWYISKTKTNKPVYHHITGCPQLAVMFNRVCKICGSLGNQEQTFRHLKANNLLKIRGGNSILSYPIRFIMKFIIIKCL